MLCRGKISLPLLPYCLMPRAKPTCWWYFCSFVLFCTIWGLPYDGVQLNSSELSASWAALVELICWIMQRLRLYHVCMSLCSHMMFFEGMGRLMEGKKKKSYKAVQHIDSVIFVVALTFTRLFSCLCLQCFNALPAQSRLSALCRAG